MRLAYVALTRAQNRSYVYTFNSCSKTTYGPLTYLLDGGDKLGDFNSRRDSWKDRGSVDDLATAIDAIGLDADPVELRTERAPSRSAKRATAERQVQEFSKRIDADWTVTSFTALHEKAAAGSRVILPDREDIFGFPSGAHAGTCLHSILERVDFQSNASDIEAIATEELGRYGFDSAWATVVTDMVERLTEVELCEGFSLSQLSREDRVDELEFSLELGAFERADLGRWLGDASYSAARIRGFLRGYIDLVFRIGDRYYLADYKSNWLGDGPQFYAPERLKSAMHRSQYHLQYQLYALALHRWLVTRIADYDYKKHFGGAYYFYLRGLDPKLSNRSGVFFDRPSEARIQALDELLLGSKEKSK